MSQGRVSLSQPKVRKILDTTTRNPAIFGVRNETQLHKSSEPWINSKRALFPMNIP